MRLAQRHEIFACEIIDSQKAHRCGPVKLALHGIAERRIEFRPKQLEIHCRPGRFKLIAQIARPLQPIIDIEKPLLSAQAFAPNPSNPME
jgi:hypothetical protein